MSLDKILTILASHKKETNVQGYITALNAVRNEIEGEKIAASVDLTKPAAKEEIVKKSDIELPRSIDTTYEEDGVTYNYKNSDAYLQVWNDAIDARDAYEGFYDGDFTNAYSSYVDAHDACCSKLDNISNPECDKVTNYAKKAVEDFKDNYILSR